MSTCPRWLRVGVRRALLGLCLALGLLPARLAGFGAEFVTIIDDRTDWYKWARELEQWRRQYEQLTAQLGRLDEGLARAGDARRQASVVLGEARVVSRRIAGLLDLPVADDLLRRPGPSTLERAFRASPGGAAPVGATVRVGEQDRPRERARYESFARQETLLDAVHVAAARQREAEQREFAEMERALSILTGQPTEAEVAAAQAGLEAAQLRLQVVRAQTERLRAEAAAWRDAAELEERKRTLADEEEVELLRVELMRRARASAGAAARSWRSDPASH